MSETRRESPSWAYALEGAIFHGLFFGLLGPAIAFSIFAIASGVGALPKAGFLRAMTDIVNGIGLLGTVYALIAYVVIGPMMFISGLLISALARSLRDERSLGVAGFFVAAAMTVAFMPITGDPGHHNRLPYPWDGPLQMFVSGLTGFVLVRATRFLRVWRDRAANARSGALR